MRRTKIVATLGPSCNTEPAIRELVLTGVDVFRLNFSHGTHEQHAKLIEYIRTVAISLDRYITILADIQGPKLRIGEVEGTIHLERGAELKITTSPVRGNRMQVSTSFSRLPEEVKPGERILINDGLVELAVVSVEPGLVVTRVVHGGPISSRKGMNFPDSELSIPVITDKDRLDLEFAAKNKVDYVAASFVRRREDVENIRKVLDSFGGTDVAIISKLEKAQAIDALEAIMEASDGVMVARGDLGVELPPERVPIVQKKILQLATFRGRFAITATQMLESMTTSPRPTRAEASDVANAIFDGSDAVMLSAETASGVYPVKSVEMMSRIVITAEENPGLRVRMEREPLQGAYDLDEFTDAMAGAARYAAEEIDARYIVVFTQSGFTARLMSKFRPKPPIVALTSSASVARRMNILWGVMPFVLRAPGDYHEQIVDSVDSFLLAKKMVDPGDRVVILMGSPMYQKARTNVMRVHTVVSGNAAGIVAGK